EKGGGRRLFHHQAASRESKVQISRRKLGPRPSCRRNHRQAATEAKFAERKENRDMNILKRFSVAALPVLFSVLINSAGILDAQEPSGANQQSGKEAPVSVPNRAASPLYKGEQGTQKSEIEFAPLSRTVTVKFQVEDPNGYFL